MTNRELAEALRVLAEGYVNLARRVQEASWKDAAEYRRTAKNYQKIAEVGK